MSNSDRCCITRYLRVLSRPETGGLTDAQLLARFAVQRDEAAFEVLVWRHGPKVLSVCRRMLRQDQDTEDAFQATFMILVRKAGSIARGQALGGWLHRVATRVCLLAQKRAGRHQLLTEEVPAKALPDTSWSDLRPVLDEEINRLPAKYRAPFVLCYCDGMTNEEAARALGCPKGTVLSRLAWARQRLRTRLTGRGVVLSGGWLSAAAGWHTAQAAVPAALVHSTLRTVPLVAGGQLSAVASRQAAILTQGVLQTMLGTKIKAAVSAVLLVGILGIAGIAIARQALTDTPIAPDAPQAKAGKSDVLAKAIEPSQAKDTKAQAAAEEKRYVFQMAQQPWKKVVEWYSDISGLPFTGRDLPGGDFTYNPPKNKTNTLAEITGILNEALLVRNYYLIRGDASFTLVPADQWLDPTFLPRVRLDDLAKRGKNELVTVLVPAGGLSATAIAPELKKLMGPFGEVIALEKSNQLLLADTAMSLLSVHKAMQDLQGAAKKNAK
jgi:RNA polymerase sigma factor (sigma-70 family)